MDRPQYVNWIVREDGVVFEDQQPLNCYRLSYVRDDAILDDWALHIRKQYVPDGELEEDAALNKLTVEEYLRQYIIPQKGEPFGPTARSNDISEILFADLFEFILNYEVPRCKQHNRSGKNESEHGTDIIAYRFFAEGKAPHKNDELEQRVKHAFAKLRMNHEFNKTQLEWLKRIEKVLLEESVLDEQIFEVGAFKNAGGFTIIDRRFGGKLREIMTELNEYLYDDGGSVA